MSPRNCGPISTTTPTSPARTPATLPGVMRSSAVRKCAATTENSGVVPIMIEASPLAICTWPQAIKKNGSAELSAAMMRSAIQLDASRGTSIPPARTKNQRMTVASATRQRITTSGGSSGIAIALKKKVPPQSTPRTNSRNHSTAVIRRATGSFIRRP